ncbi:pancreatic lipase-related protein 2-like [Maniola hyperantus]|uniref:pancreatic lipase-related protein 2-like n=1 Tax=Aphantopus hyperantus TaxID=2795564 RepID=UPI0015682469|nr:pancreatic lipase-related protein 2-like [Maniola hyperantus]
MTGFLFLLLVASSALAEPVNRIQDHLLRSVQAPNAEDGVSVGVSNLKYSRQDETSEYYLYTRHNPTTAQRLVINNDNSITSSKFNVKNPVVVVIHGYLDNTNSSFNEAIRDAYLHKSDVNIIMVDWSPVANDLYWASVNGVPRIGRSLRQFLSFLNKVTGASFGNMHLIGFSLGAHVAGIAGRELGGSVARITGLDPAGPLWYGNSNCLKPSDAVYVEAIHSDASIVGLGIALPVADADFFPNGGTNQPGCPNLFCNHNRAWELFAATVTFNNLVANRCANMIQVVTNTCRGDKLHMGNDVLNKRGSGLYRVDTKATYPF